MKPQFQHLAKMPKTTIEAKTNRKGIQRQELRTTFKSEVYENQTWISVPLEMGISALLKVY